MYIFLLLSPLSGHSFFQEETGAGFIPGVQLRDNIDKDRCAELFKLHWLELCWGVLGFVVVFFIVLERVEEEGPTNLKTIKATKYVLSVESESFPE